VQVRILPGYINRTGKRIRAQVQPQLACKEGNGPVGRFCMPRNRSPGSPPSHQPPGCDRRPGHAGSSRSTKGCGVALGVVWGMTLGSSLCPRSVSFPSHRGGAAVTSALSGVTRAAGRFCGERPGVWPSESSGGSDPAGFKRTANANSQVLSDSPRMGAGLLDASRRSRLARGGRYANETSADPRRVSFGGHGRRARDQGQLHVLGRHPLRQHRRV
jgi:hypothetical protein